MIAKDFASSITPTQQTQVRRALSNPLVWAESVFPAKIRRVSFPVEIEYTDNGIVRKKVITKTVDEITEGWMTRPWQQEVVEHPSRKKVVRVSRRAGKTALAIVKCLHKSFVEGMGVIVVAPMERQVVEIYQTMHKQFIDNKPMVFNGGSVVSDTKSPYQIKFANGGFINFITAGTKSGGRGEAVRGQGHGVGLIYIDEADYMTDDDIESILAIQVQSEAIEVIMTSTPTGKRRKFFELCTKPPIGWKAFHKTAWEAIPGFNEDRELEFRQQYGADGYAREFLAEFGDEATGVFDKDSIDKAAERGRDVFPFHDETGRPYSVKYPTYGYAQTMARNNKQKTYRVVGVDWDKYGAGTQIVVVEAAASPTFKPDDMYQRSMNQPFEYVTVIHRKEIPKSKFTLTEAVNRLVQINKDFQPDFYYLDAGYGEHQIESLQVMGMECDDPSDPAYGIHKKIRRVNFSEAIPVLDPITKQISKKPIKPEMVGRLVQKFDSGEMVLSPYDTDSIKQLENYIVEKITSYGQPKYTSLNEHIVDAMMLAVWGLFDQFNPKIDGAINKAYIDKPIGERYMENKKLMEAAQEKATGRRPNYFQDDVDRQNMEEEMTFNRNGLLRPDSIRTSPGVPSDLQSNFTQSTLFQRGGRGWSPRKGF